jgi:protoheme IX farnesyltransferase
LSTIQTYHKNSLATKLFEAYAIFAQITKLRLSLLVVFSAVMSYWFADVNMSTVAILLLSIAGFLVTASANIINQILEKETDKLMDRTKNRPLPNQKISVVYASLLSGLFGIVGIAILGFFFNPISGLLGALSLISYAFIYTPFKKISPVAVFIGAVPGSMPLLIGWTAATGSIGIGGVILFAVQFFWQIPHFWSIAWLLNDDYNKAGFYLLPNNEKSRKTALLNIPYLVILIFVGFLPFIFQLTGLISLIITTITGLFFLLQAIQLSTDISDKSAKKLMFASFIYLPVVLISLNLDKI